MTPEPVDRAIGYVCVPTSSNGDLHDQIAAVTAFCEEQGLSLCSVVHDVEGAGRDQRPSLAWALEQLANQQAETLVVARLRDLSSNVANLAPLLSWFNGEGRRLIAIDLDVDTSTEAGRLAADAIVGVGGWEHERISERTRRGLEAARSRGNSQGRTAVADIPELQERIAGDARAGHDAAGDRRRPQRGGRADAARRRDVASLERPARHRIPPPVLRRARDRAAQAGPAPALNAAYAVDYAASRTRLERRSARDPDGPGTRAGVGRPEFCAARGATPLQAARPVCTRA